ncbi:MAG: hypothetical protein RLZZ305_1405 [Actinomycetota bacterium]
MLFWFVGTAYAAVWFVFRDPRFNLRLLAVGALLPDAVDVWSGGTWVMHSVVSAGAALALVMLATRGRKPSRPALLALPIGMFMHLVFDGVFARTTAFWWPLAGTSFGGDGLPSFDRGWVNVPLEVAGLLLTLWVGRASAAARVDGRTNGAATC